MRKISLMIGLLGVQMLMLGCSLRVDLLDSPQVESSNIHVTSGPYDSDVVARGVVCNSGSSVAFDVWITAELYGPYGCYQTQKVYIPRLYPGESEYFTAVFHHVDVPYHARYFRYYVTYQDSSGCVYTERL